MNIDTYFRIGTDHQICQDYVFATPNQLVVCDGCSAADNSDVGARLLCHAKLSGTEKALPGIVNQLGLDTSCLYATYLSVKVKGSYLNYDRWGDGSLVLGMANDKILVNEWKYTSNMPFYMAYPLLNQEGRYKELAKQYNNKVTCTGYSFHKDFTLDWKANASDEQYLQLFDENVEVSLTDIKWVAILSDGLSAFTDKQGELVPVEKLVKELFSFKNLNGEFVKRRMRVAFKEFEKLGYKNTDDFSIGVMVI